MGRLPGVRGVVRWTALGVGVAAVTYGVMVTSTWYRYGNPTPPDTGEADPMLDGFMPSYEVVERHHVRVFAPAEVTLRAATEADMQGSALVRGIFRARELLLGAGPSPASQPKGLLAQVRSLGWRVLGEQPGREIVVGAVTRPWEASVIFRGLPPQDFRAFEEPGYVKIAWTLRADPVADGGSIFRTETRVLATDAAARSRFRWYWARFSPGIVLIRYMLLRQLKAAAERQSIPR